MRRVMLIALIGLLVAPGLAIASGGGFDEELFETFLKAWVENEAQLWLKPPKDMDEIRELQKPQEAPKK